MRDTRNKARALEILVYSPASILQMGSYSQKMLLPYACTISGEVCDLICDLFDFVIKVLAGNQKERDKVLNLQEITTFEELNGRLNTV